MKRKAEPLLEGSGIERRVGRGSLFTRLLDFTDWNEFKYSTGL